MLIDVEYIRRFRPIARNIADDRVGVYIREAEHLDVMPVIGAELYERFSQLGRIVVDEQGRELLDEQGVRIRALYEGDLPTEEFKLLNGGYYTGCDGVKRHFEGVKTALAYLAYARFVRNHSTNVTPYGVVTKIGEDSTPVDARTIAAVALDAQRIGQAHLQAARSYWADACQGCECGADEGRRPRKRFIPIGE